MQKITLSLFCIFLLFIACHPETEYINVQPPNTIDCSIEGCGQHGTCNPETNICECDDGFNGPSCIKTFQKRINVGESYEGGDVVQTQDGNFIWLSGTSLANGGEDVYIIKTDEDGNKLWERTIGGPGIERGYAIEETTDGRLVITGAMSITEGEPSSVYLLITDANGENPIERTFGGNKASVAYAIKETSQGGLVMVGKTIVQREERLYLIITDGNGENAIELIHPSVTIGRDVIEVEDGFIVAGGYYKESNYTNTVTGDNYSTTTTTNTSNFNTALFKFNKEGVMEWEIESYFNSDLATNASDNFSVGTSIVETSNGTLMLGAYHSNGNAFVLGLEMDGSVSWVRIYNDKSLSAHNLSLQETSDNALFVLLSLEAKFLSVGRETVLMKVGIADGELIWDRPLTGVCKAVNHLKTTEDGGLAFVTKACVEPSCDLILYKTDQLGLFYE